MATVEVYDLTFEDEEPLPGQMTFADIDEMKEITDGKKCIEAGDVRADEEGLPRI